MTIPSSSFIPGLIKAVGNLGSYFISRGEVNRQNRYNSPREQVRRLREAGLPYAAASEFSNEQTSIPDTSGIGKAAEGLSGYYETQKVSQEIEILKEQESYWRSQAGIKSNEFDFSNADVEYLLNNGYIRDGDAISWYRHAKEIDIAMKEIEQYIGNNKKAISDVDKDISIRTKEDVIKTITEKLDLIKNQSAILKQQYDNTEKWNIAKNTVIDTMTNGGLSFFEAISLMVLQSFSAKVSGGGLQLGN